MVAASVLVLFALWDSDGVVGCSAWIALVAAFGF